MIKQAALLAAWAMAMIWVSGCTVHPNGEREERGLATREGKPFVVPATQRSRPPLSANPTPDDLVRYALLTSPEVEQHYWDWRAAIEQIPQDGTQPTNLAISAGTSISGGNTSRDRTTVTLSNDPMANIVWPSKLSAAARRAMDHARAAGLRFQKAKLDLRQKVLEACYEYALAAEQIRLETETIALLKTAQAAIEARSGTGAVTQQDVLKARNELDLALNGIEHIKAQQLGRRGAIGSLLSLPPDAPLNIPTALPDARPLELNAEQIIARAAEHNPELQALTMELRGQDESARLAKLQYVPDFSLAVGTDLAGMAQSLSGMATVPILRHAAIDAAIAQAKARLNAADAMARQAKNDLSARLLLDIAIVRDADRQLALFDKTLIPRAGRIVRLNRTGYETGQLSLTELLEAQRSRLSLKKLQADLRVAREKHLLDIETAGMLTLPAAGQ